MQTYVTSVMIYMAVSKPFDDQADDGCLCNATPVTASHWRRAGVQDLAICTLHCSGSGIAQVEPQPQRTAVAVHCTAEILGTVGQRAALSAVTSSTVLLRQRLM